VPEWEKPEQILGFSWLSPDDGVARALQQLESERPDVVIVVAHSGLDRDPASGEARPGEMAGENSVWQIAERFPQLAAVIYGHSHQRQEGSASATCCSCSRATGPWRWRASTSP